LREGTPARWAARDEGYPDQVFQRGGDPGHAAARHVYERAGYQLLPVARYFKNL
jgi:hypothetical protein